MKDKQKNLEDLDFVTELSMSELEGISGGFGTTISQEPRHSIVTRSTQSVKTPPEDPKPEPSPYDPHNPGIPPVIGF